MSCCRPDMLRDGDALTFQAQDSSATRVACSLRAAVIKYREIEPCHTFHLNG